MVNKTIKSVLYLTIFLINFSTLAHDYSKVWEKVHKSTVVVLPTWPGYNKPGFGAPPGTAPAGTGFYLSLDKKEKMTKYILTAAHVIKNAKVVEIRNYDNKSEKVDVILTDFKTDIAILKSKNKGQSVKVTKKKIKYGNEVCLIGNSFGLGQSLSCGIVSGLNRTRLGFNPIEDFIQTDAAVNPGASGAPLLNNDGELVGMVDAIYTKEADIDAGVNFAIDIKLIEKFLNKYASQIK
jgi:S1-C subfamily serine protease